jgi:predicted RNase H-like HicB family nuclease
MHKYHINIFYSQADKGFVADIPDLRHCSAFGRTPAEALKELEVAKGLWIEAAKARGKALPKAVQAGHLSGGNVTRAPGRSLGRPFTSCRAGRTSS